MSILPKDARVQIREVWAYNLDAEFALIRSIASSYPYLAMDTEFPGVVLRPVSRCCPEYHYQMIKANVDNLKLIQVGLTFSDASGNLPSFGTCEYCVWQFNFREFNLRDDLYAADSIELLRQSGIDFNRNQEAGIESLRFRELLLSSGIVMNEKTNWITFHSAYDFGYLLKLLICRDLPLYEAEFFHLLRAYFPTIYDVKYLMKFCDNLHGGLNKLAETLKVERHGCSHQAGSDSLLTSCTYRRLRDEYFCGCIERYAGVLYGLGGCYAW